MDKRVYISACPEYERELVRKSVRDILAAYGGAQAIAAPEQTVLIKANLLMNSRPEQAVTTHPLMVEAIAAEFVAIGCRVIIADSPGGPYNAATLKTVYRTCGMDEAAVNSGAELNDNFESSEVAFPEGRICKSFPIIDAVQQADVIISAAKLKTHGLAYMTAAVKNLFGAIPGLTKPAYHSKFPDRTKFNRMLVDVCECVKPAFAFIDGVVGMEGRGPSGGRPKKTGVIIGATNAHAADMAGCRIMGFKAEQVATLTEAMERGFIPRSFDELEYLGDNIEDLITSYIPAIRATFVPIHYFPQFIQPLLTKLLVSYPVIEDKCVGCGVCATNCPEQIIRIENRHAVIDYDKCIKCYCCHEFCPIQAIGFKRFAPKKND
ncbi:MAG: DUF362 domain-containing protein [Firmicutes bacterium]|nr:DUF362 domain-containing protein [Bacillota bacterium]